MAAPQYRVSVMFQAPSRAQVDRLAQYFVSFGYKVGMLTCMTQADGTDRWSLSLHIKRTFDNASTAISESRMTRLAAHFGARYDGWSAAVASARGSRASRADARGLSPAHA